MSCKSSKKKLDIGYWIRNWINKEVNLFVEILTDEEFNFAVCLKKKQNILLIKKCFKKSSKFLMQSCEMKVLSRKMETILEKETTAR